VFIFFDYYFNINYLIFKCFFMFIFRIFFIFIFLSFPIFGEDFKFEKVKFYGLNYLSQDEIFNKIVKDKTTYECSDNLFFKKLSDLGFFNKIEAFWNNNELKVFCIEKPIIDKVFLYIDSDKEYVLSLLSKCGLYRGCFYDLNNVTLFKKSILKFYFFSGFNNPDISVSVDFNCKLNSVNLNIKVNKSLMQKIKDIDIIGVSLFDKDKLMALLSYSKSNWMSFFLKDDLFFSDLVENDIENLKNYYFDRGYSDFHVEFIRVILSKKENNVSVLLSVYEGERYYINSINLSGEKNVLQSELLQNDFKKILFLNLKMGDVFSRESLSSIRLKLKDFLVKNGFFNTDINFSIFFAGESRVGINFTVIKSLKTRIRYIGFIGNFFTCDSVLRRMIPFMEGSILSLEDIEFSKNEIMRSGISDSVNIDILEILTMFLKLMFFILLMNKNLVKLLLDCLMEMMMGLVLI
jgi:outer membrane protein insertion porin family